jgi:alpha-1,6-mannosyltransferase
MTIWLCFFAAQFHSMFYISRTLPNLFAFPLVILAQAFSNKNEERSAIYCLVFAMVIFRFEIAVLSCCFAVVWLIRRRLSILQGLLYALQAFVPAIALTVLFDSHMWKEWTWPEMDGIFFNVVENKSHLYGVT